MTWISDAVLDRLRDVATRPELPSERYVLGGPVGRGGMGAVYAARDTLLDRDVAIKVSNAVAAGTGLDERLRDEALVLARLEHPGIVPIHDAGVLADGRLFYVMKLVRGETLATYLARLTGEPRKLAIFERVVETVAFAHAAGIVHRDLKPENIMVGSFGEVLVLDWGLAKVLGGPARNRRARRHARIHGARTRARQWAADRSARRRLRPRRHLRVDGHGRFAAAQTPARDHRQVPRALARRPLR